MATLLMLIPCSNCPNSSDAMTRRFVSVNNDATFGDVANAHHKPGFVVVDLAAQETGPWTRVGLDIVVGHVLTSFEKLKYIRLQCITPEETSKEVENKPSAFMTLMTAASEKVTPAKKSRRFVLVLQYLVGIKIL